MSGLAVFVSPQLEKVYLVDEIWHHEQVFVNVFIFYDLCMICVCLCVIQDMLSV